jgi:hypothetical protein
MGIIFAFNIIIWICQCAMSLLSYNAKALSVLAFLLYIFGDTIFEFIGHLFDGYTLLEGIPEKERVFDSLFIHYTRLIIVSIVFIISGMIILSICGFCLLAQFEGQRRNI